MNDEEQINRIGRPILTCAEGAVRAAAIRRWGLKSTFLITIAYIFLFCFRLCRFFKCVILTDVADDKRTLHVDLLPAKKGFLSEYMEVQKLPGEETEVRPVGIPGVFFPLDTCGRILHRRGMTLKNENKKQRFTE